MPCSLSTPPLDVLRIRRNVQAPTPTAARNYGSPMTPLTVAITFEDDPSAAPGRFCWSFPVGSRD